MDLCHLAARTVSRARETKRLKKSGGSPSGASVRPSIKNPHAGPSKAAGVKLRGK